MPSRKLPPNRDVVRLYRSGMSSGEIAEKFAVAPSTVVSLLRRIGEPLRSAAEATVVRTLAGRVNPSRYWAGKKQSREMVEARVSKIRGEKHYLWKGGQSRRSYRSKVKKMVCESCLSTKNLSIHHKDLDHFNNSPENLQVLCVGCHMSLHKTEYWKAKRNGLPSPKSNGPVGWVKK